MSRSVIDLVVDKGFDVKRDCNVLRFTVKVGELGEKVLTLNGPQVTVKKPEWYSITIHEHEDTSVLITALKALTLRLGEDNRAT